LNITPKTDWPPLPLDGWRDTLATVHMWTQVVGKVCIAFAPPLNHFWGIALHVTSRGLTTPPLWDGTRTFTLTFDFIDQRLLLECSDGGSDSLRLEPRTVADFYHAVMSMLQRIGITVRIWTMPVEIPSPIRFENDVVHASYDGGKMHDFWRALLLMKPVFEDFRGQFLGKSSPVHFFWGSFDLASTRFSGRRAPERPGADPITREAYSHEVISHGFWPGSGPVQEAAFYAYAAPEPAGLKEARIQPAAAFYHAELSEFVLPYEAVRSAESPESALRAFLETTYDVAATLGHWPRRDLERS
jgi:Family of unknown function (DUF5996)